MHQAYPEPTAALLSCGKPREVDKPHNPNGWPNYVKEFGLSLEDTPHLIRMLNDPMLHTADIENPHAWADIHAWRALGQLGAIEAIPDLIHCLDYEDAFEISDWNMEEIPKVFGKIGTPAIELLSRSLEDDTKGLWTLIAISNSLVYIAKESPESRSDCIAAITRRLERYRENEETLNGFLISDLVELKAIESLDLIRKAFQANTVDIFVQDDLEDIEIELGVRQTRATPKPHRHLCGTHCHADHDGEEGWVRDLPQPQRTPKIGRNDPCLCGSGKKYKKCCLV